jgi:PAS domain S-box-containing protein
MKPLKHIRTKRDLKAVLDHIVDGVVVQDMDAQIVYINEAAASLLGFPDAAAALKAGRDQILRQVQLFDEQGRALPVDMLPGREALRGAAHPTRIIRGRAAGQPEGTWRWAWVKASPVPGHTGRTEYVVTSFQEITQLKNAEIGALDANHRITKLLEQVLKVS